MMRLPIRSVGPFGMAFRLASSTAAECWKITASATTGLPPLRASSRLLLPTPKSALPCRTVRTVSMPGVPGTMVTSRPASR